MRKSEEHIEATPLRTGHAPKPFLVGGSGRSVPSSSLTHRTFQSLPKDKATKLSDAP